VILQLGERKTPNACPHEDSTYWRQEKESWGEGFAREREKEKGKRRFPSLQPEREGAGDFQR